MTKPSTFLIVVFLSLFALSSSGETADDDKAVITVEEESISGVFREIADELQSGVAAEIESEIEKVGESDTTIRLGSDDGMSAGETLIAFTAIMMSLGMPILILLLALFYSRGKRKQKLELVKTFLDANRDVPENILREFDGEANSHLSSGVKITGLGLGIIIALYLLTSSYEVAGLGLIPLFIGLSRLLLWQLEGDKESTLS